MHRSASAVAALASPRRVGMVALSIVALGAGCTRAPRTAMTEAASPPTGLVLDERDGERRSRRPRTDGKRAVSAPIIIKVDGTNGGSTQLFMGYEDILVGESILPHYHPKADEILFVHRGHGIAMLGAREAAVSAGSTIYVPHGTRVTLRNTGDEPITIAFVFADPAMSSWFRDGTVPEGQPTTPMTASEVAARRERHRDHIVHEQ